jgi:glycosyltransferase involved in cell wall biosynthesis
MLKMMEVTHSLSDRVDIAVSVIVPVRDRREMLSELLQGLDKQTYRSFEVVVIDDGSRDGSDELARRSVVAGRPVVFLRSDGEGTLSARQLGIDNSIGSILAFIDSDCVPDPAWLESAVAVMENGAEMVTGRTRPMRPLKPMERSVASGTEGLFPSCNVFYRRDLYVRLGGFDAGTTSRWRFGFAGRTRDSAFGEDTLLGWRAVRSGADERYVPAAIVEHQVFPPDLKDFLLRTTKLAAFPAMTKELPELRQTLMRQRIFLGDYSRVPVYAMAIALGLRRRRLAAITLVWWMLLRLRAMYRSPHSTLEQIPWLPVEMAADVATAGALVAGSIRSGSLVL